MFIKLSLSTDVEGVKNDCVFVNPNYITKMLPIENAGGGISCTAINVIGAFSYDKAILVQENITQITNLIRGQHAI